METVLESIIFDPTTFDKELQDFEVLLKSKVNLSETNDIQPFFKKSKHLTAYLGTFAPNIGPATELCFEYEFCGDFRADVLLATRTAKECCVVGFKDGSQNTSIKHHPKSKNPEW